MAAILGLSDDAIRAACEQAAQGEVVAPVNFNSPGQVVIAGHKTAVERAVAFCKEAGARRALPLAVSAPSHCELMRPAAEQLAEALKNIDIQAPAIPVVHNVSASVLTTTAEIKQALVEQLYRPILWTDCVNAMVEQGVTHIIECGPGKVLSGLNKRIEAELTTGALGDSAGLEQALSLAT